MKKTYIYVGIVILILLVLWYLHNNRYKTAAEENETASLPDRLINIGTNGDDVKLLQRKLNDIIVAATKNNTELYCVLTENLQPQRVGMLTVDGIFGNKTLCAIKAISGKTAIYVSEIPNLKLTVPAQTTIIDTVKWE